MNLLISFSGGETSAYMTRWLLNNVEHQYDEIAVLFANTGQENEQTLEFVQRCDDAFNFNVVWLEAVVVYGERVACKHKVTNFKNANRDGEVFEKVINKYGIPNKAWPHCTRELKLNPIKSYIKSLGWTNYHTAIGIRSDEIDRMSAAAKKDGLIYPLVSKHPMTKPMINQWWAGREFRLNLKGYQGNCKWCWKKSLRKHMTLMKESPEVYDFPKSMEKKHGLSGHNVDGNQRVFFRENMSTNDLFDLSKQSFTPARDDADVYPEPDLFDFDLDSADGCSESCEIDFSDETKLD